MNSSIKAVGLGLALSIGVYAIGFILFFIFVGPTNVHASCCDSQDKREIKMTIAGYEDDIIEESSGWLGFHVNDLLIDEIADNHCRRGEYYCQQFASRIVKDLLVSQITILMDLNRYQTSIIWESDDINCDDVICEFSSTATIELDTWNIPILANDKISITMPYIFKVYPREERVYELENLEEFSEVESVDSISTTEEESEDSIPSIGIPYILKVKTNEDKIYYLEPQPQFEDAKYTNIEFNNRVITKFVEEYAS